MAMPEASVHENDCLVFREHEIRLSGEVPAMQAKPETTPMEGRSDRQLRFRVAPANARHHPAADFGPDYVGRHRSALYGPLGKEGFRLPADGWARPSCARSSAMCGFMSRATARTTGTTTALPNWR